MKETSIVYFGTPQFSAEVLEYLVENLDPNVTIKSVVTQPDKPVGRDQTISHSAVSQIAKNYKIPLLKPEKLSSEFIKENLKLLSCDLFVVVSYGKIIPQRLLDIPVLGAINLHGSLLPKYRGASPIQSAILEGEKKTGVTTMLMDKEMDHGPILKTSEIKLSDKENYQTLSKKMWEVGSPLLIETIYEFLEGRLTSQPQDHEAATYTKIITKEDGSFKITKPPTTEKLDQMIRAYFPWPGVWTWWKDKQVKFYPEGKVQMAGKKPMALKDFLNGHPDFPIKEF